VAHLRFLAAALALLSALGAAKGEDERERIEKSQYTLFSPTPDYLMRAGQENSRPCEIVTGKRL
jgi:hypothetical protein